ncbi:thioesterase family protein [soil metagenome]
MNLIFRTLLHLATSRRRSPLGMHDLGTVRFRVLPTDLDILGHMNNGVYFSIMDLGRVDLMIRAGAWSRLRAAGIYPVMASETMTFRKSLQPWQLFDLETRLVGYDEKGSVFTEQRFVVDGEIYASAMTRARFLKKGGGTVSLQQLAEVMGLDAASFNPPEWVARWAADVALPSTRAEAPSTWS